MTMDVMRSREAGWTTGSMVCANHEIKIRTAQNMCVCYRGNEDGLPMWYGEERRWRSNSVCAVAGGRLQLPCNATAPPHFEVRIGKVPLFRIETWLELPNKIVFKLD